jgi:putative transposase
MRTVKRKGMPLNVQKQKSLKELCKAYAREKRFWLHYFQSFESQAYLSRPRTLRDEMIRKNYRSAHGLQARHWKLALEEAAETWDKYWQAIFVTVRSKISRRKNLSDNERHYAYWLLKGYPQFTAMMQGKCPEVAFPMEHSSQKHMAAVVRNLVKKYRGKAPSVKKARSVRFDANCYECFEHKGRQYIKLMSLIPGKRIVVPLSGKTAISGTITLILSEEGVDFHVSQELKKKNGPNTTTEAVDFGYTEVMTDTQGIRYGTQFGIELTKISDLQHQKMQKRHKLYSIEKKTRKLNANLRKYNLGKKKQHALAKRSKATLEKEINTAINQLISTKNPSILITEDLRHTFRYDKTKKMNRRMSNWLRGEIQDRISFKALAEGFRHEQVNPAYGSQSCPHCEFVDQRNRKGDRFQCLHCGHEDISDRIAALNYARRFGDQEIGRYTPYREVKTILMDRFHRRLEAEETATVPGRTLETVVEMCPPSLSRHHVTARRENSRQNWTVNQRAK